MERTARERRREITHLVGPRRPTWRECKIAASIGFLATMVSACVQEFVIKQSVATQLFGRMTFTHLLGGGELDRKGASDIAIFLFISTLAFLAVYTHKIFVRHRRLAAYICNGLIIQ